MVQRHLVVPSALLVEPDPVPPSVHVQVFDVHAERGADATEGVHHRRDECPVTKAADRAHVDGVEELPAVLGGEHRRLPFDDDDLGTAHGRCGVEGE